MPIYSEPPQQQLSPQITQREESNPISLSSRRRFPACPQVFAQFSVLASRPSATRRRRRRRLLLRRSGTRATDELNLERVGGGGGESCSLLLYSLSTFQANFSPPPPQVCVVVTNRPTWPTLPLCHCFYFGSCVVL